MAFNVFNKKYLIRLLLLVVVVPVILILVTLVYLQSKQDEILQSQLTELNSQYKGLIEVGDSDLSLFKNFPYTSIRINDVVVYENKQDTLPIMKVGRIYVGFDLLDILNQNYNVQSVSIENGFLNLIRHEDGTNNFQNALMTSSKDSEQAPIDLNLKRIRLKELDIHKLDEASKTAIETYVYKATGGFKANSNLIEAHLESVFELNIIQDLDTTYIKNKQFKLDTHLTYDSQTQKISIQPTTIVLEHGDFEMQGAIETKKDLDFDLKIKGKKSNFDLLIAFAPHDLVPMLESYNNAGDIYFNANIDGLLTNEVWPYIEANFGTDKAFLENTQKKRRISDLGFQGRFTNGTNRNLESMELSITNMSAKLERGQFLGSILIKNFKHPDVKAQIDADFNIEFIAEFFDIKRIENTTGHIGLKMTFHDIIDLNNPELALNDLNKAYYSQLQIKDLKINSGDLPVPLNALNARLVMNGETTKIDAFNMLLGDSDLRIAGEITNLPSILHKSNDSVKVHLDIESELINLAALTNYSKTDRTGIDERLKDFKIGVSFKTIANQFIDYMYLPKGEFFIDSLHMQLEHYPHKLHDFNASVIVDDKDLEIIDFSGFIDQSDFHFNGYAHDYGFWFKDSLNGDVVLEMKLNSNRLRLEDIFTYKGENYVPEEYRHEVFNNLNLDFSTALHYEESDLNSLDVDLKSLVSKMKVHPNMFKDLSGHFHYEDEQLTVSKFKGILGKTDFDIDMNYFLGDDMSQKKKVNRLKLTSNYIDFDAIMKFDPQPIKEVQLINQFEDVKTHIEGFNLYELPFSDMTFNVNINHLKYHKIDLQNIDGQLRTTKDHYIHIDTLMLDSAGGKFKLSGYFNGSDPEHIYFKPNLSLKNVDLDRLAFKFENFGQDHLVSENLHGKITSEITGNIRVYPDMIPDLDQSEIKISAIILEGRLENYEPMELFSDYIGDKNLKMIKFDTLQNNITITNGEISIPNMTIESTIGHMEMSGTHDSKHNIEYYLRIPWKTVRKASLYKVFGNKKKADSIFGEEDIVKQDKTKRTRYLNLKIIGTVDDFDVSLGKEKSKN